MGLMKYIESIKTVVLIILVLLSITLTFSIWSYSPKYEVIDRTKLMNVQIDDKHTISQAVKPYKLIGHINDTFRGTTDPNDIDALYSMLKQSQVSDLTLVSEKLSYDKMSELMASHDTLTLQFSDDVPMAIFQSVLPTVNKKVSGIEFSQITILLKPLSEDEINDNEIDVYFSAPETNELYSGKLHVKQPQRFIKHALSTMKKFDRYIVLETEASRKLYVPKAKPTLTKQQYFSRNVDGKVTAFKNALFTNPKIVKTSQDEATGIDKYSDDRSVMTVYSNQYTLNFSNIVSESDEHISKSHLIDVTLGFLNEHGAFTNDYRYESVNYSDQKVVYKLFMSGLPVEASTQTTSTTLDVKIANGMISRYSRPYYQLENLPADESSKPVKLKTAQQVYTMLVLDKEVPHMKIEDLRLGYSMSFKPRDDSSTVVFTLEPTWFYKIGDTWMTVAPEVAMAGGGL